VAGAGGTSWSRVEANRGALHLDDYANFGTPTAVSIIQNKKVWKKTLLASGGVRNGLDVTKCLVIGANACSTAYPVILAQQRGGVKLVEKVLTEFSQSIRVGLFSIGAKSTLDAKNKKWCAFGKTREWIEQLR
jgi:isopentenyl-diphosphate delta-isomerase